MLAKESSEPFDDEDWLFEIKWDGFRAIAEAGSGDVRLYAAMNSFIIRIRNVMQSDS